MKLVEVEKTNNKSTRVRTHQLNKHDIEEFLWLMHRIHECDGELKIAQIVQAIDVNKITPEMSNADIIKMMRKNIVMFNLHDDWEKRAIIPDPFK
jgi:hypothetical protein